MLRDIDARKSSQSLTYGTNSLRTVNTNLNTQLKHHVPLDLAFVYHIEI